MAFPKDKVASLLARCHRRCCICHRFCGVKIETDHIIPKASDGTDDIENAIPVCFECHAEIHSYNDDHPRGRKFSSQELRQHKEQWLRICDEHPELLISAIRDADVGPLQALIDELDFNSTIAKKSNQSSQVSKFQEQQFFRAIHEGSISLLRDDIRDQLLEAYRLMAATNAVIDAMGSQLFRGEGWAIAVGDIGKLSHEAGQKIDAVRDNLLKFLSNES